MHPCLNEHEVLCNALRCCSSPSCPIFFDIIPQSAFPLPFPSILCLEWLTVLYSIASSDSFFFLSISLLSSHRPMILGVTIGFLTRRRFLWTGLAVSVFVMQNILMFMNVSLSVLMLVSTTVSSVNVSSIKAWEA